MKKIKTSFFNQKTTIVAEKLIGKELIMKHKNHICSGIISETEAYTQEDPACHAYLGKKTPRNEIMFQKPGTIYIYFIYGMHYCLNFVTESQGRACAVLIRELIPKQGLKNIIKNRQNRPFKELTNGPAKLVQALNISPSLNGISYNKSPIYISEPKTLHTKLIINKEKRIGIKKGKNLLWRFNIKST